MYKAHKGVICTEDPVDHQKYVNNTIKWVTQKAGNVLILQDITY
jgi:hypothetical protein